MGFTSIDTSLDGSLKIIMLQNFPYDILFLIHHICDIDSRQRLETALKMEKVSHKLFIPDLCLFSWEKGFFSDILTPIRDSGKTIKIAKEYDGIERIRYLCVIHNGSRPISQKDILIYSEWIITTTPDRILWKKRNGTIH
jgi:hypothetical protein